MTLNDIKAEMVSRGFTPSASSWEDEETVFVFSKELATGRSAEGSAMTITHSKGSGGMFVQ